MLRPDGRVLRASRHLALVRPQRGVWAALSVPRLEVRRHRPVCRHAKRAGTFRLREKSEAAVVSARRAWRRAVDLYGSTRIAAAASRIRVRDGAARANLNLEAVAGVQLDAGD